MGLRIGFSFYNLTHVLASWMEFGVMRILRNSNLTLQQWRAKSTHVIQTTSPKNLDTMNKLEDQLTDHIFSNKVEIGKLKEQIDYLEEFVTNLNRADPHMSK